MGRFYSHPREFHGVHLGDVFVNSLHGRPCRVTRINKNRDSDELNGFPGHSVQIEYLDNGWKTQAGLVGFVHARRFCPFYIRQPWRVTRVKTFPGKWKLGGRCACHGNPCICS
jgi:hypothetical protein